MSKTYIGIIVSFLGFIFQSAGVPFVASEAEGVVAFVVALTGAIYALYGRWRVGDLKIYGARK